MRAFDFYGDTPVIIKRITVPAERMPKEVFFIPALVLLGLIILMQRGRRPMTPATKSPDEVAAEQHGR